MNKILKYIFFFLIMMILNSCIFREKEIKYVTIEYKKASIGVIIVKNDFNENKFFIEQIKNRLNKDENLYLKFFNNSKTYPSKEIIRDLERNYGTRYIVILDFKKDDFIRKIINYLLLRRYKLYYELNVNWTFYDAPLLAKISEGEILINKTLRHFVRFFEFEDYFFEDVSSEEQYNTINSVYDSFYDKLINEINEQIIIERKEKNYD